jgi:NAD(P)-dependent dehydrogenase (short-subunit alcohol dehydrogenase family)
MKDFNGKVAVVTGGASGVGRCLAQQLAAEGAKVVITDINADKLAAVAAELTAEGPSGTADMRSPFWDLPMKDWQWGFGVHVMGPVHGIKAFVPRMIEQDGEGFVVNTTSGNGALHSLPNTPIYASSKAALTSLTEVLYAQLKEKAPHIKVGILFPGPKLVNTSLLDSPRPDEYRDAANPLPKGVAMSDLAERMGGIEMTEPDDVAAYCLSCVKNDQFWMLHPDSGMDGFEARVVSLRERKNP